MIVTRFAPSPNGPLHLGHAFAAIVAHDRAREAGGRFLLRIEDIDGARSRPGLAEEFRADLAWLGLDWDEVPPQSTRLADYAEAAERLRETGLLYPCQCTRAQIAAVATRAGSEGPVYPGTCRTRRLAAGAAVAWRLDVGRALARTGRLYWEDEHFGMQEARPDLAGDVVLVRKADPASYHLAATLDDAVDRVTLVTRGVDLFAASHVHRLLQALLDLPVPRWHHHPLLLDGDGRKLAKRRNAAGRGWGLSDRRRAGESGLALTERLRAGDLPTGIALSRSLNGLP